MDRVAVGVVVVVEHRDRHDVARTHHDLVVVRDGRAQLRRRGDGDDDDVALGRLRAVRDAVRDAHLLRERGLVADAERLVVEHRDRDPGVRLDRDGLHDEDAAGGIGVVGQHVDEHLAAAGQQGDVAHGHRGQVGLALGDHVDPHDARHTRGAGGHHVLHVVRAGGRRAEGEGLVGVVGHDVGARDGIDAREAQRLAARAHIVDERRDGRRLPGAHGDVVGVGHRVDRADRPHVEADRAHRDIGAVGDRDLDILAALRPSDRAVGDAPVRRVVGLVALRGCHRAEEDVVAVGVDPVGQHVVGDRPAGLDRDGRHTFLGRCGVDVPAVHREGDARGVGAAAAV